MVAEELVCVGMPVGQLKEMAWTLVLYGYNLAGHEGLPDSPISSSFPKSASLRSLMASTILASIFCTEG